VQLNVDPDRIKRHEEFGAIVRSFTVSLGNQQMQTAQKREWTLVQEQEHQVVNSLATMEIRELPNS